MKSRKMLKILGASGLAIMMGAGVIFGVGATASSSSATAAQLGDSAAAQEKFEHDAGIWSGGDLGLDPTTDPIVWTTDTGIQIRSHDVSVSSSTTTVSTVAYKYVTLGSYNWIIIGYSTNSATQGTGHVGVSNSNNYEKINGLFGGNYHIRILLGQSSKADWSIASEVALGGA